MSAEPENTPFVVCKARTDEIGDLVRMRLLLQQHMEKVNDRILKHNETWELGLPLFYSRQIDSKYSMALVVSDNLTEQIVGMALGMLIDDPDMKVKRYVKINDVWVDEGFRRKGLCSLMIRALMKHYGELDIKTFTLNYVVHNLEAEQTWTALGFRPVVKSCVLTVD